VRSPAILEVCVVEPATTGWQAAGGTGAWPAGPQRARSWWNGASGAAGLARFVTMGLTANLVFAATFLAVGSATGAHDQVRNLLATITSTVVANELHRRYSFHAEGRVSWLRGQAAGGMSALLGLAATSIALAAWHWWAPDAGSASSLAVVYLVNTLCGLANFATLRWAMAERAPRIPDDTSGLPQLIT
jgi:putative flippase GtrA